MNAQNYFEDMYHNIWQSHDIGKIDEYYAKDFKETVSVVDETNEPLELTTGYDDIVQQAAWQKDHYPDTTMDIKKIVASDDHHLSVYFYSSSIEKESGELRHRSVCGIWRLNEENKINRVWAVVTPHYPR